MKRFIIKTICHSCEGRNLGFSNKWIPAFAGMTNRFYNKPFHGLGIFLKLSSDC